LVTRTAAATGQAFDAAFFQKITEVASSSGFGNFRYGLVLRCADTLLEAALATVEQTVEYFYLLCG